MTDIQPGTTTISGDVTTINGITLIRSEVGVINFTTLNYDLTHDVSGLPNPYLGLQSFDYDTRFRFAGRKDAIDQTLKEITTSLLPLPLYFITGTSGSGKSSFVQAGLLPALKEHFSSQQHLDVKYLVFRPAQNPLSELAKRLIRLADEPPTETELTDKLVNFLQEKTPGNQINIVIIDQFEELFTQSEEKSRQEFLQLLEKLPAFDQIRTYFIATLRADYVPDLVEYVSLYEQVSKHRMVLRQMNHQELNQAILRPLEWVLSEVQPLLQRQLPKYYEQSLLEQLVKDAGTDAANLPLLQVTLQQLWQKQTLKRDCYGQLTDAITEQAETVYECHANGDERTEDEKDDILKIFLALVSVSPDDKVRRDVRRSRLRSDLVQGQLRLNTLVEELVNARLLYADGSDGRIDIIHESLISNWTRLREAVAANRATMQQSVRFELLLEEWLKSERTGDLLTGQRLTEAVALDQSGNIALLGQEAQDFLKRSLQAREEALQKEVLSERTKLQAQKRANRTAILLAVIVALTAGAIIGVFSWPYALSFLDRGTTVRIDGGEFIFGSDTQYTNYEDVYPSRVLTIDAFEIDQYEVSNERYSLCVLAGRCSEPVNLEGLRSYKDNTKAKYPVVGVTALQAAGYCQWLGRRLPNEVEWERAARGKNGGPWPWGVNPIQPTPGVHTNFRGTVEAVTQFEAATRVENSQRLYNFVGNVSEWTSSYIRNFNDPELRNLTTYSNSDERLVWNGQLDKLETEYSFAVRGGNWRIAINRLTIRLAYSPTNSNEAIGFRCAGNV